MSRDITLADTIYMRFTTRAFATGIPGTLGGIPIVSAYENDSVTQITAGITLGVDHDSVAGLNLLTIVATGANGYESGKDYDLVITTGTVGGVSVVGEVVGSFTIERSASAVDLANGTDGLSALKALIDTIDTVVDGIQTDLSNGTDGLGALKALLDTIDDFIDTEIAAITAAVITNAAGADIAADIIALKAETVLIVGDTNELQGDWVNGGRLDLLLDAIPTTAMRGTDGALTDKAGFSLSTAGILAVWHQAMSAVVTAGSAGKLLKDEITSARMATLTDWINGGRLDLLLDAIPTTAMRGTDGANTQTPLTAAQVNAEVVDALNVDTYAEPGQELPPATTSIVKKIGYLYKAFRNRFTQTATEAKLYNDDGVTVDQKATVSDDATTYDRNEMGSGP